MSSTAVVNVVFVGGVMSPPNNEPVTCGDVADVVPTAVSEKPVRKLVAAGLTPTLPLMADGGTVETPVFASTAKLAELPSNTGGGPCGTTASAVTVYTSAYLPF